MAHAIWASAVSGAAKAISTNTVPFDDDRLAVLLPAFERSITLKARPAE